MIYNFNEEIELKHPDSSKWMEADHLFGGQDLLPLWVADMDFRAPQPVVEALRRKVDTGLFTYAVVPDSLLESVSAWMARRHKWKIEKNAMVYASGVVNILEAAVRAFTAEGEAVIVQPPVYGPFASVVTGNGRELVLNPLKAGTHGYEMDFDDLEVKIVATGAKLLLFCSPHNPVGRLWRQEELKRLADICEKHEVLIVSDEIHADLVLEGEHLTLLRSEPRLQGRAVICVSPGKTFNLAGLQASFALVPDADVRSALDKALGRREPNPLSLAAAEAAYREGEEWLEQCLSYLRDNVKFALDYLSRRLPEVKVVCPEATYLLWLDLRPLGYDAKQIRQLLVQDAKVGLSSGSAFVSEGWGHVRINAATRRALLEEGLRRIADAVDARREKG